MFVRKTNIPFNVKIRIQIKNPSEIMLNTSTKKGRSDIQNRINILASYIGRAYNQHWMKMEHKTLGTQIYSEPFEYKDKILIYTYQQ